MFFYFILWPHFILFGGVISCLHFHVTNNNNIIMKMLACLNVSTWFVCLIQVVEVINGMTEQECSGWVVWMTSTSCVMSQPYWPALAKYKDVMGNPKLFMFIWRIFTLLWAPNSCNLSLLNKFDFCNEKVLGYSFWGYIYCHWISWKYSWATHNFFRILIIDGKEVDSCHFFIQVTSYGGFEKVQCEGL